MRALRAANPAAPTEGPSHRHAVRAVPGASRSRARRMMLRMRSGKANTDVRPGILASGDAHKPSRPVEEIPMAELLSKTTWTPGAGTGTWHAPPPAGVD